jgi:aminopeptidase YwaD
MNMKKIVCVILCIAIITTLVPALGSATTQGLPTPPGPAYAPRRTMPQETATSSHQTDVTAETMSDVVVSMIEQVGTAQFLSYEENLTQNGPRPTGSANCIAAAAYIYSQFENLSLPVRYVHWNNGGYSSDNVEATINGTNESSDDIYIICAHYDTVSAGPGADDDTSGTVAVLMAALIMSQYQFEHTIKFVTFSGEEQGLLGSAVYAQQASQQGWDIIGVLNCDMISYAVTTTDGDNLIVYENTASEWMWTFTSNVNTEYSDLIQLTLHHGGSIWGSDHNSFWDQGYDALFYFEYTETPYYHTSQDTMEHINASYAVKNMRLVFATLAEMTGASYKSNPPTAPTLSGPASGVINVAYS